MGNHLTYSILDALVLNDDWGIELNTGTTLQHGLTEQELAILKGCLKNKAAAQEKLYKDFYGYAMSVALRYSRSKDESAEILNESFFKVFTRLDKYDFNKSFRAWLRRIVINTAIDYYRANKKYQQSAELTAANEKEFDFDIVERLTAEEILGLLQELPPHYQMVFNLYEIEGYSHREIAEMMEIPEGTSRSNLTRAKQKLREMVKQLYDKNYARTVR
jgi:RNA polymerase sigma-70 factor (ECF subfamily)